MFKVYKEYGEFEGANTILVNEVLEGIDLRGCDNFILVDIDSLQAKNIDLQEILNNDKVENIKDYLNDKDFEWKYLDEVYEMEEVLKIDGIIVDTYNNEVYEDTKEFYDTMEEVYYYEYYDGHNWRIIELSGEGTEVEHVTTLEEDNTYTIELYFDKEENEYLKVYNSFYAGSLLEVQEILNEDEAKEYLEE